MLILMHQEICLRMAILIINFGGIKTLEEKLAAAVVMIETSFNTKDFVNQKVDRKLMSSYKKTS